MNIAETAMLGNGLNLQAGVFQEVLCIIDPLANNIGGDGNAGLLLEEGGQVATVDIQLVCQVSQAERRGKIGIYADHSLLYCGRVALCGVVLHQSAIGAGHTADHRGAGGRSGKLLDLGGKIGGDAV